MMEHIARECMRWDTVVARAFRVALGLEASLGRPRRGSTMAAPAPASQAFAGVEECFANETRVLL